MTFTQFCEAHGLIMDRVVEGRWARTKTTDKPRSRNGAYKFLGEVGFCQNHATMEEVAVWHPDGAAPVGPQRDYKAIMRQRYIEQNNEWNAAAQLANQMIQRATVEQHPYLAAKGFPDDKGLVLDGELLIPMHEASNIMLLNSLQRITADGTKKFLQGGRAKGSVFALGVPVPRERWLCEGYATALSLRAALRDLRRSAQVVCCFSANNLTHVAKRMRRPAFVLADHDASKTGERCAQATGLPWTMPEEVDTDANDLHQCHGLRALVKLIRGVQDT